MLEISKAWSPILARPVDLAPYQNRPAAAPPSRSSTVPDTDQIASLLDGDMLEEAGAAIASRLACDPALAETWFLQARLFEACGRPVDAQEACRRAMALWPDILPVCRMMSSLAEQTGDASGDSVESARRMLLARQPDDAATANRIAATLCAQGRVSEALPFLRLAAPILGHAGGALWNYTTSLALTGSHHELLGIEPLLGRLSREVPPPFGPFVHLAGARLALRHDREMVLQRSEALQASADWLDAAALVGRLRQAIAVRQPFSVVALPEAQARLAVYATPAAHLTLSEGELSAIIDSVWTTAFGSRFESHGALAAGRVTQALLEAIQTADVVAIADAGRIARAHEHFGFNAELQQIVMRRASPLAAGLEAIAGMHEAIPFLRPLLAELSFLGFVGCHPDLAPKLGRFCHVGETKTYLVPGALNRDDIPQGLRGSDHYPAKLEQTLAALVVPSPGAVFLVAAGLLGPVYCGRIKQLGGIAIEIDSLATNWARS